MPYAELADSSIGEVRVSLSPSQPSFRDPRAGPSLVYLSDLLSSPIQNISRRPIGAPLSIPERVRLAVDLASSFFCILGTPWYRGDWGKESLQLAFDDNYRSPQSQAALLERRFPDKDPSSACSPYDQEEAFIRLSVCLEELCFGKPLEDFPEYKRFCGPGYVPHDGTPRAAAWDIAKLVEGQLGPHYSSAVRKCLELALNGQGSARGDQDFWQKAHDGIVDHLQEVLRYWVSDDIT